MTFPTNNLVIVLTFVESLDLVSVEVRTEDVAHRLQKMGFLKGKDRLKHLLEAAEIDNKLDFSEETNHSGQMPILVPDPRAIACSPRQMVDQLERRFQEELEFDLEILSGEPARQEIPNPPHSWTVYSSSLTGAEGLDRVKSWFAELNAPASKQSAAGSTD